MYKTRFFCEEPIVATGFLFVILLCLLIEHLWLLCVFLVLFLFLLFFYRQPPDPIILRPNQGLHSPAYGKITRIFHDLERQCFVLSVFLSPLDIHVQHYPCDGFVVEQTYDRNGNFNLAYELDKSNHNEKLITVMDSIFGQVKVTQIAGFLARRISTPERVKQTVSAGEYMGMIKFGSRVDIEMPDDLRLVVRENQYVKAGDLLAIKSAKSE